MAAVTARGSYATAVAVVFAMLVIYGVSNPIRANFYNHFVWQASAWLEGQAGIRYPVHASDGLGAANDYFQDVLVVTPPSGSTPGRALIPFPPLPAVVLLPFVALFGLTTNAQLIATILGAFVVGLAYWVLGYLPVRPAVRLATTVLFGLGTVFWYAAELGSTWYLAHVVAVGLTFASIGVALGADPAARLGAAHDDWEDPGDRADGAGTEPGARPADGRPVAARPMASGPPAGLLATPRPVATPGPVATAGLVADGRPAFLRGWGIDRRQVLAGLLLGLAATARLTVIFGLPFLVLVGGGGSWRKRALSATIGAAIPVIALLGYDFVTTGHLFHPAYEYLYREEIGFYPRLFPYLDYHPDWSIEDPRYIPQNLLLMLGNLPEIMPACDVPGAARGLFDAACPYIRPRADGMSLLLVSPALLLAIPALRGWGKGRVVSGAALAVLLIVIANLMHFSQGWVQFGYRFSNDFIPFLLLLVALGIERVGGMRRWVVALIGLSIAVNLWGVVWGHLLGW